MEVTSNLKFRDLQGRVHEYEIGAKAENISFPSGSSLINMIGYDISISTEEELYNLIGSSNWLGYKRVLFNLPSGYTGVREDITVPDSVKLISCKPDSGTITQGFMTSGSGTMPLDISSGCIAIGIGCRGLNGFSLVLDCVSQEISDCYMVDLCYVTSQDSIHDCHTIGVVGYADDDNTRTYMIEEDFLSYIGDLKDLTTDEKSSIVAAINTLLGKDNIDTAVSASPSDDRVPSTKLMKTLLDAKAPKNHASTDTGYGIGSDSKYGHLKITTGDTAIGSKSLFGSVDLNEYVIEGSYSITASAASNFPPSGENYVNKSINLAVSRIGSDCAQTFIDTVGNIYTRIGVYDDSSDSWSWSSWTISGDRVRAYTAVIGHKGVSGLCDYYVEAEDENGEVYEKSITEVINEVLLANKYESYVSILIREGSYISSKGTNISAIHISVRTSCLSISGESSSNTIISEDEDKLGFRILARTGAQISLSNLSMPLTDIDGSSYSIRLENCVLTSGRDGHFSAHSSCRAYMNNCDIDSTIFGIIGNNYSNVSIKNSHRVLDDYNKYYISS